MPVWWTGWSTTRSRASPGRGRADRDQPLPQYGAKCDTLQAYHAQARSRDQAGAGTPFTRHPGELHASCHPVGAGHPHHGPRLRQRGCSGDFAG